MRKSKIQDRSEPPRWFWYSLCFILPAAVLTWAYAAEGFYPFGEKSVLAYDMAQQYVGFFCALKKGDVFFSWSKALGTSYIGVFSYYVSSPLSFLTLLVPNQAMPLGLMMLSILKLGLAGFSYSVFARYYFSRLDICVVLSAVAYALCTYAVAYSMCIMWLDGLIWLPIILLGVEWQLDERNRWLFPASLAVCFFSTWYISYMIGGFCLLWLAFRVISKGLDRKCIYLQLRNCLFSALWALCLTAWLWLPSLLSMTTGKLDHLTGRIQEMFNFSLSELLPQFFYGHFEFFHAFTMPYVFCGTVVFVAAVAYFFLRPIKLRERLAAGGIVGIMVLSMWVTPLDRVWHFFQMPNSFPFRYSFLVSFLVVFLAQHTMCQIKDSLSISRPAALVLVALLCWEMGGNARLVLQSVDYAVGYIPYADYAEDYAATAQLVNQARADAPRGEFYRMGATWDDCYNLNSPLSFGYNGITHYSSLYNVDLNATLRALGLAQDWYWCAYYGSSHLTDAIFDVRYVFSDRLIPGYRAVSQINEQTLYENPNALPLAFLAKDAPDLSDNSPFARQNILFTALTGLEGELFTPAKPEVEVYQNCTGLIFTGNGSPLYLDMTDDAITDLWMDDQSLMHYNNGDKKGRCLYCVGMLAPGETKVVFVNYENEWSAEDVSYFCNLDLLSKGVEKLSNTKVDVHGTKVSVAVQTDSFQTLVTTIPAEDGWSAEVDGHSVDLTTWMNDTFLCLKLPAGEHQVVLLYTPPGLSVGLALAALSLFWAGTAWYLWQRDGQGGRPRRRQRQI